LKNNWMDSRGFKPAIFYMQNNAISYPESPSHLLLWFSPKQGRYEMLPLAVRVPTAVTTKNVVVWNVTLCSSLDRIQHFGRGTCFHFQGNLSVYTALRTKESATLRNCVDGLLPWTLGSPQEPTVGSLRSQPSRSS
jgi:hypothetical protein